MLFICYPRCTTCRKAQKWLDEHKLDYEARDIKKDPPTRAELGLWHEKSSLPLKRFWNTSGTQYKALGIKDRLPGMSVDEQLGLLSADGLLVKRPILVYGDAVLVGFKEEEWAAALL